MVVYGKNQRNKRKTVSIDEALLGVIAIRDTGYLKKGFRDIEQKSFFFLKNKTGSLVNMEIAKSEKIFATVIICIFHQILAISTTD